MISDIDEDGWIEMEQEAFARKLRRDRHRIALTDAAGFPAPPLARLSVFLRYALGDCHHLWFNGVRHVALQADTRWRQ